MAHSLQQRFIAYFFPQRSKIDILEPLTQRCSHQSLMKIRFICWFILTLIYVWDFNMAKTIFIQIIYLTQNGYCLTYIYFSLVSTNALLKALFKGKVSISSNYKYWVEAVYEVALSLQMVITLIYWILLFPFDYKLHSGARLYLYCTLHVAPIVCLLVDFRFSRYRFDRRRVVFVIGYALIYTIGNCAYTLLHKPVYPILNWRDLETAINFTMAIVIAVGSHWYFRKLKTPQQIKDNIKPENKKQ